ncbi:MAG: hypothetical protein ACRDMX_09250 [Solirubrobacteraceae bacterium]
MALRNRVTPLGEIVADPARGLVYGNRGCLHDARGQHRRSWNGRRWISCRLRFRGRHRSTLRAPGRYTELFFLDEATAFAAGHRPCAECRREDYNRFVSVWSELHPGDAGADAIDRRLHDQRIEVATRRQRRHKRPLGELPDGAFVLEGGVPWLVLGPDLRAWAPAGYGERCSRTHAAAVAVVLTPPSLLAVLSRGWDGAVPLLHPSALGARALGNSPDGLVTRPV